MQVYQFTGAVDASFPLDEDRPRNSLTFMLRGIAVTWEDASGDPTAPTTSEMVVLGLEIDADVEMTPKLLSQDPTSPSPSLNNWVELLEDGPIALPTGWKARVLYTNTDGRVVKVAFLGYWS